MWGERTRGEKERAVDSKAPNFIKSPTKQLINISVSITSKNQKHIEDY